MNEIFLVLDESGAKGYSNNPESEDGELGVMAGYLLPISRANTAEADLGAIRSKFLSGDKLHITDLAPHQQEELRNDLFAYFTKVQARWLYEAIYVQGFFEHAQLVNQLSKEAHDSRRSNVKISWRENRDLLHAELFQGVFSKAVAFCLDNIGPKVKINVITDRTDASIIKKFQAAADEFLGFESGSTTPVTGFDIDSQSVLHGEVQSKIGASTTSIMDLSGIEYSIKCEDSALTLAADVLVNSVNFHLKSLQKTSVGVELNDSKTIAGHPLEVFVYGTWSDPDLRYSMDAAYAHPSSVAN